MDPSPLDENLGRQLRKGEVPYREAVGSLFLVIVSRPDIMHGVSIASIYLNQPTKVHRNFVNRIMKYLKGNSSYGILYKSETYLPLLEGYSNSDFAGDCDTRSTTGYVYNVNWTVVTWCNQRQPTVSFNSWISMYCSIVSAKRLHGYNVYWYIGVSAVQPTIFVDNQSTIKLVKKSSVPSPYKMYWH